MRFVDPLPARIRPKGEGARGLEVRRNPLAWLRDTPEIYDLVTELEDSGLGDPDVPLVPEELVRRSYAEINLVRVYRAAIGRRRAAEEKRLMEEALRKSKTKGGGNGDQGQ